MEKVNSVNYLESIFQLLKKSDMNYSIYTKDEIKEETDNIEEFKTIVNKLPVFFDKLKKKEDIHKIFNKIGKPRGGIHKISDIISELDLIISDIEWQYDQMDEMIKIYTDYCRGDKKHE